MFYICSQLIDLVVATNVVKLFEALFLFLFHSLFEI